MKNIIIIVLLLLISCDENNYNDTSNQIYSQYDSLEIKYLGEVEIKNLIVLNFIENYDQYNSVIISYDALEIINNSQVNTFKIILENYGALLFYPYRFDCIVDNYKSRYNLNLDSICYGFTEKIEAFKEDRLRISKPLQMPNGKTNGSWSYEKVYMARFLHFLIKKDILYSCTSRHEINPFDSISSRLVNVFIPLSLEWDD